VAHSRWTATWCTVRWSRPACYAGGDRPHEVPMPQPPSVHELDDEQRDLLARLCAGPRAGFLAGYVPPSGGWPLPGPFGPMLLSPAVGGALQELGAALRYRSRLPDPVRELAIVATAGACGSAYELDHHLPLARAAGLPSEVLDEVAGGGTDLADPVLGAVATLVRSLVRTGRPDADALGAVEDAVGAEAGFELVVLVGYYRTLAAVLAVYAID
jgi:4-carboxymuconolactone decarboxylase